MTSVHKTKKVHSSKSQEKEEKDFDKDMEKRLIRVEKITDHLERTFDRIIDHINKTPARLIGPPNPPAYVS